MKIRQFQVDAFAHCLFEGNPAAVCPLDDWLPDRLLQSIAAENNLSETAFFVPAGQGFDLRWFTPATEVDLCGHATLASAHILFESLGYSGAAVSFNTRSGELIVKRAGKDYSMDFPAQPPQACAPPAGLKEGLGASPLEVLASQDYMAVFHSEAQVRSLTPDYSILRALDLRGVIATAPGDNVDFVSRFFAPGAGIDEDPVTGSAHCALAPYWSERLGRQRLQARQVSARGGRLECEVNGARVILKGGAVTFMQGQVLIEL
ncbi:MAG: isomerase [Betaproteobacteria bacterium SG8_40]|jgi:PhzF family phenazine biosynthesis protein|nr:MAG: isomerase [Betaproteobacteria bacterium SG8_40]